MSESDLPRFRIICDSFQLDKALRQISGMKGADRRASFQCDENGLKLTFGFGTFRVACRGRFSGAVRCERKAIQEFLRAWKFKQATSTVEQCDGELRIDDVAINCSLDGNVMQTVDPSAEVPVEVRVEPVAKKPITMLALLSQASLSRDPSLSEVYAAVQEKAQDLVAKAADLLSPLEITREDIQLLLDRKIKESK